MRIAENSRRQAPMRMTDLSARIARAALDAADENCVRLRRSFACGFLPSVFQHSTFCPSAFRAQPSRLLLLMTAFCALLCLPASAQRTATGAPRSANPTAQTEMNAAARAALDDAVASLQRGALNDAEREARSSIQAAPRSPAPHNVLGVILDRQGRAEAALAEFNAAIKLDPAFVSARNNVGRMLAERGKVREAIEEFERVLKIDPSHVQAHYNLGALYGDSGDFAKSADHFAAARAAAP